MNTHQIKWTPQLVACHFEEAVLTESQLPQVKVRGYFKSLPNVVRTPTELALIELEWVKEKKKKNPRPQPEPELKRVQPTSAAFSRLIQTLDWMPWMKEEQRRKIIWWRAARISFRAIGHVLGCNKTTVASRWQDALKEMSQQLNKRGILPSKEVIEREQQCRNDYAGKMDD